MTPKLVYGLQKVVVVVLVDVLFPDLSIEVSEKMKNESKTHKLGSENQFTRWNTLENKGLWVSTSGSTKYWNTQLKTKRLEEKYFPSCRLSCRFVKVRKMSGLVNEASPFSFASIRKRLTNLISDSI